MFSLHESEKIVVIARKTWFLFAATVSIAGIFLLVPVAIFVVFDGVAQEFFRSLLSFWVFLAVLWWLFVWLWFFTSLVNYYLDVFVVTNERIIHVAQHGFFHREVSELRLSRVQDVNVIVKGLFATFFHYGDIRVATAGETQEFIFNLIDKPYDLKDSIMQTHREHLREEPARAQEQLTRHP